MNKVNANAVVAKKTQNQQKQNPGRKIMGRGEMFGCKKHPRVVAHKYSCKTPLQLSK